MTILQKLLGTLKNNIKSARSHTETSANEANNKGSLTIDREIIKNTPFTMVGTPKEGYWLTMGKHRLSQAYKTKKDVLKYLKKSDWTLVTSIIIAFIHDRKLIDNAYAEKNGQEKQNQQVIN